MRYEPDADRSLIGRPGRLAAVGAASLVCLLSVSGALGFSLSGEPASATQNPVLSRALDRTSPAGATDPLVAHSDGAHAATHDSGSSGSSTGAGPDRPRVDAEVVTLPKQSGSGKRVVFDESAQRVWLVGANGKVERTYLVSGSKYDNLDPGTYTVSSHSRYATAYNSNETLNYMVRFAFGNTAPIGFHAIPVRSDGTLVEKRSELGQPASDGCVRQWITDARALWLFAPVGTTVVVVA
jgi:lipoprotein-anchoring transpeptidase ErfK/SrfK